MYSVTRNDKICFKGIVEYFSGNLLILIPKKSNDETLLDKYVNYFNSSEFRIPHIYSGRFKIGHRELRTYVL